MSEFNFDSNTKIQRLPTWIKFPVSKASELERIQKLIKSANIHTICEEGRCPNRAECYSSGTATFLLGGSTCSRSCAFCQVKKGKPNLIDFEESNKIAKAVKTLKFLQQ